MRRRTHRLGASKLAMLALELVRIRARGDFHMGEIVDELCRDHDVSRATGYRLVPTAFEVLNIFYDAAAARALRDRMAA